jgi:hypothetical protein
VSSDPQTKTVCRSADGKRGGLGWWVRQLRNVFCKITTWLQRAESSSHDSPRVLQGLRMLDAHKCARESLV